MQSNIAMRTRRGSKLSSFIGKNQGSGKLEFSLPDGLKAIAPAQIIGTYNSEDHTWLWAWANPSIEEKLQADARQLLKYGEEHHIDRLTKRRWVGIEEEAWARAALAVKLCGKKELIEVPQVQQKFSWFLVS